MQFPFAHSSWFFAAYAVGLFYLFVSPNKVKSKKALILAYVFFGLALLVGVVFTPFRAGAAEGRARDLIDIWGHGLTWLSLGVSLTALPWAVLDLEFDPLNLQGKKGSDRSRAQAPKVRASRRKAITKKAAKPEPAAKPKPAAKPEGEEPEPVVAELVKGPPDEKPLHPGDSDVGADSDIEALFDVGYESDYQEPS